MNRLVPVEARGPAFVDELRAVWAAGDAAMPLDPRWPDAARRAALGAARPDVPVLPGDALVLTTSGTSGDPKAVVLTHDALEASSTATSARLQADPASDRWLACLPLSHIGGLAVVLRALHTGTPLTVHDGFDAAAVAGAADDGCTLVSLVPTALQRLDPARFRLVLLGGQAPLADRPANVIATYGMTETGSGVVYDGRPLDGVEVRTDTTGQLEVRGPMLLRAYRGDDPAGADPKDPDGWFPTGDLGAVQDDGTVVVHGRAGDLIITGGENVWPAAVERALAGHPAVAEVAVVGRPDAAWGQAVTALVVPTDSAAPPTLEQLRDHAKQTLPAYAAPRALELVDALPRTVSGKVRRAALS
ncbi:MAG: AMP-binding protein [Actinomycetota bacterium]|nr:AMP-binding protein [Actinomycetota bacterium]